MCSHVEPIYKKAILLLLLLLLPMELSGLTCIQDLWAISIETSRFAGEPPLIQSLSGESSPNIPIGTLHPSIQDECPCHYMMIPPSGPVPYSILTTGKLSHPLLTYNQDNIPQIIFHPPLFQG